MTQQTPQTTTGLKRETAAALSYVMLLVTGFIFLLLEKDPFVRFHAMQSIVFSVVALALNTLIMLTVILAPLVNLLVLIEFAVWLVMIYKASQGEQWELPYLGKYVYKLLPK